MDGEKIVYEARTLPQGGSPPPHSGHYPTPYYTADAYYRYTQPPAWREEQPSIVTVVMAYVHSAPGFYVPASMDAGHGVTPAYAAPNPYAVPGQSLNVGGDYARLNVLGGNRRR